MFHLNSIHGRFYIIPPGHLILPGNPWTLVLDTNVDIIPSYFRMDVSCKHSGSSYWRLVEVEEDRPIQDREDQYWLGDSVSPKGIARKQGSPNTEGVFLLLLMLKTTKNIDRGMESAAITYYYPYDLNVTSTTSV